MVGFEGIPYETHPPQLKEYLLVTMGYHVGGFFTHFFSARKNDFLEMALHHIVAIYLFGGCYLFNVWNVGSIIAFLHDIADITTNIVKTFTETNYTKATAVVFVTHICIWFYTRNIILPYIIYQVLISEVRIGLPGWGEYIVKPYFAWLLSMMFLLHCYWFMLFCKMLKKYASSGSTEDQQNKTEVEKKKA